MAINADAMPSTYDEATGEGPGVTGSASKHTSDCAAICSLVGTTPYQRATHEGQEDVTPVICQRICEAYCGDQPSVTDASDPMLTQYPLTAGHQSDLATCLAVRGGFFTMQSVSDTSRSYTGNGYSNLDQDPKLSTTVHTVDGGFRKIALGYDPSNYEHWNPCLIYPSYHYPIQNRDLTYGLQKPSYALRNSTVCNQALFGQEAFPTPQNCNLASNCQTYCECGACSNTASCVDFCQLHDPSQGVGSCELYTLADDVPAFQNCARNRAALQSVMQEDQSCPGLPSPPLINVQEACQSPGQINSCETFCECSSCTDTVKCRLECQNRACELFVLADNIAGFQQCAQDVAFTHNTGCQTGWVPKRAMPSNTTPPNDAENCKRATSINTCQEFCECSLCGDQNKCLYACTARQCELYTLAGNQWAFQECARATAFTANAGCNDSWVAPYDLTVPVEPLTGIAPEPCFNDCDSICSDPSNCGTSCRPCGTDPAVSCPACAPQ